MQRQPVVEDVEDAGHGRRLCHDRLNGASTARVLGRRSRRAAMIDNFAPRADPRRCCCCRALAAAAAAPISTATPRTPADRAGAGRCVTSPSSRSSPRCWRSGSSGPFLWVLAYVYVDIVAPQKIAWPLLAALPISLIAFVRGVRRLAARRRQATARASRFRQGLIAAAAGLLRADHAERRLPGRGRGASGPGCGRRWSSRSSCR